MGEGLEGIVTYCPSLAVMHEHRLDRKTLYHVNTCIVT